MTSLTWQGALQSLLAYYQISTKQPLSDQGKLSDVEKILIGTSLKVRPMRSGGSAFGVGIDGALLALENGTWLAVVIHDSQAYLLNAQGQRDRVLTQQDMEKVLDGFVFSRKETTNNHVLSFYRHHKKQVVQIMVCGLLVNIFALTLPLFSAFVYDKVLGNHIHETLWALAIGLVLVAALDFSIKGLRILIAERFAISSETDIDREVFEGLLNSKTQKLPPIGRFLDRYKRLLMARDLLSSTYLLSLIDIPFLILFAVAVAYAAGWLVVIPLVLGGLMLIGNFLTSVPVFDYDSQSKKTDEQKLRLITDVMVCHEVVVGSGLRSEMADKWRDACAGSSTMQSLSRYWRGVGSTVSSSLAFLSYVFIIVGGAYMVDAQTLSSGGLLAASMLGSRMIGSFASVVTVVMRFKDFKISLRELSALLPKAATQSSSAPPKGMTGRIAFDNVTCRLKEGANPVLSAINLRFEPGEMVGIAGIPGSGKTTLLRLIGGIVAVESGEVLLDHYPVSKLSVADMAAAIGYKPQDICLVEGSIEDNVRAGGPPLTPEQREWVLTSSGLGWVFQQGGIDWTTEVGPQGSRLSGGQRQLVALARALLNRKPILMLDEPTNGLDSQLEAHLAKQLAALKGKTTILVSTHNKQILSVCDRLIVVGDGRILANGPREKILVA